MGNVTHSYELIGNIGDLPGVDIVKFELLGVKNKRTLFDQDQ